MSHASQAAFDTEVVRLFDQSLDLFCVAGFDGYLKLVNPAFEQALGYTREELLATPFLDITHPDDVESAREALADLGRGEDLRGFVTRVVCADGALRWIEWNTSTRPDEAFVYGVGRDITDRRRADAELAALRRVATLVAEGVHPSDLLAVVAEEVGRVVAVPMVSVVRYESDGTATECASFSSEGSAFKVGRRWSLAGTNVLRLVRETSRAARIDDYSQLDGEIAESVRRAGIKSRIGIPILVAGRLWGAMVVSGTDRNPLPERTEPTLADFTELLATAIANLESREALARLAEEQAALRRVATLVAVAVPPSEIFSAVSREVSRQFGSHGQSLDVATVVRFDPGPEYVLVGMAQPIEGLPLGSRWGPRDVYVSTRVCRSGRSARIDESELAPGTPDADALRRQRILSQVGSPIVVDGRLWGAVTVNSEQPLPADTEQRLEKFTDLVATAIANAESREARKMLTDEQSALRRVATLAAAGAPRMDVFAAVAEEVGRLLGVDHAYVTRLDDEHTVTVLAGWISTGETVPAAFPLRLPTGPITDQLRRGGGPVRLDPYPGDPNAGAIEDNLRSVVAAPITVDGKLWGFVSAASTTHRPPPPSTEQRLSSFTELLASAIADAESRESVARLAAEQAALRRVATLVAEAAPPEQLFARVAREVAAVLDVPGVSIDRFEPDGSATIVLAGWHEHGQQLGVWTVGSRWPLDGPSVAATIWATGAPARIDDYTGLPGSTAAHFSRLPRIRVIGVPIIVAGKVWGMIAVGTSTGEPLPADTEQRLTRFTELVATAIANAHSRSELAASRRRIVAASDDARRRIERDLHDGMQQRLVSLALALRAAERRVPEDNAVRAEVSGVATGLTEAVDELQELSRGIHPAILSHGGLASAVRTLARRATIPVELDATDVGALPEQVEIAAYFVVSEALANAVKHARASRVKVSLARHEGVLLLSVHDDGIGGADAGRGTGLMGLTDRIEAHGGTMAIHSRPGSGTQIAVELPVEPPAEPAEPG